MDEWIACTDRLPPHNSPVVVLASNSDWTSGYLQPLAGFFHATYYDMTINRFTLIGVQPNQWRVAYWMPLPRNPTDAKGPFEEGFEAQFAWGS
jgi:hypothetical protein